MAVNRKAKVAVSIIAWIVICLLCLDALEVVDLSRFGSAVKQEERNAVHVTHVTPASGPAADTSSSTSASADTQPASDPAVAPPADYLEGTALMTLGTGDDSARQAVALIQSLRDTNTKIPRIIVLLSRGGVGSTDCLDQAVKKARGRPTVNCGSSETVEWEITSQVYLDAYKKLGAETMIIDPIPDTPWTQIPGGRQIWWGMSFNRLKMFNMTQFRKILWMDSDIIVFKNIDHVMKEPMFTAAMTFACCNGNSPAMPSGGMWVVEPSHEVMARIENLYSNPVPGTKDEVWRTSDLGIAKYAFTGVYPPGTPQPLYPSIDSNIHGMVPGLEFLPEWKTQTEEQRQIWINGRVPAEKRNHTGLIDELWKAQTNPLKWPFRPLDMRYDQVVGHCECLPERDIPQDFYSVHFSCLYHIQKPGKFDSDKAFKDHLYNYALSCTRYYYMRWYDFYSRGMGAGYPAPMYDGPALPIYDAKHDEVVRANRLRDNVRLL